MEVYNGLNYREELPNGMGVQAQALGDKGEVRCL
jgi:hypothetical protein